MTVFAFVLALLQGAGPTPASAAQVYRNAKYSFQITFPEKWTPSDIGSPGKIVGYGRGSKRPDGTVLVTSCSISTGPAPSTAGKDQAAINAEVDRMPGEARDNLSATFGEIREAYTRTVGGVRSLVLIARSTENVYGVKYAVTRQQFLFFRSERSFSIACVANSDEFEKARLIFDLVADTFRFD